MALITVSDIEAAARRIESSVLWTPLLPAHWGDPERPLWLKPENLQAIGAFKVRGAFNAIGRLDPDRRARGVVAYSSGNHAQAVAYVAARFGITATIVMPQETPTIKVDATRRHGATVVLCDTGAREKVANDLAERSGAVLIPPFDHVDVIAGQGTIGLEIVADRPDVATVIVPISGGGLASGIGIALRARAPHVRIIGAEPELAGDAAASLAAGHLIDWPIELRNRTIADGLRSQPSALTFSHLQAVIDEVITVSENEIRTAMRELAVQAHLMVEPSGAVALAAYRRGGTPTGATVAVVSGGNVNPALLAEVLTEPVSSPG